MKKCTKINKNWLVPALGVLLAALALVFGKTGISQNGFTLNQYHNADAKFIGDHIITSVDEGIRILVQPPPEPVPFMGPVPGA